MTSKRSGGDDCRMLRRLGTWFLFGAAAGFGMLAVFFFLAVLVELWMRLTR